MRRGLPRVITWICAVCVCVQVCVLCLVSECACLLKESSKSSRPRIIFCNDRNVDADGHTQNTILICIYIIKQKERKKESDEFMKKKNISVGVNIFVYTSVRGGAAAFCDRKPRSQLDKNKKTKTNKSCTTIERRLQTTDRIHCIVKFSSTLQAL